MVSEITRYLPANQVSLNPCSGGLWFLSMPVMSSLILKYGSLNPCSGGLWFLRFRVAANKRITLIPVLILVLVDYGF